MLYYSHPLNAEIGIRLLVNRSSIPNQCAKSPPKATWEWDPCQPV